MYSYTLILLSLVLSFQNVYTMSRPWCLDGVGLCRGKEPASEQYSHTMTLVWDSGRWRLKAYLLGGQRSSATSSYVSLSTVTTVDLHDMTLLTTNKVAFDIGNASRPQRSGHAAVPYNGSVLLFGGSIINRTESKLPVATNEVLWLDPGDAFTGPVWRVLYNRTIIPRAAVAAGVAAAPAPRQGAAAAILNDTLWIFGGLDNSTRLLNDTWSFHVINRTWTRHSPSKAADVVPSGVDGVGTSGLFKAAMIASPDGRYLLLYGGRSWTPQMPTQTAPNEPQNRLWAFEVASRTWKPVVMGLSDDVNPACNDAVLMLVQQNVFSDDSNITRQDTDNNGGHELLVASTGFWQPSNASAASAYKMWVALKQSNTNSSLLERLQALFRNNSAANTTNNETTINTIPFDNLRFFLASKTSTALQVNSNSTPIDLAALRSVLLPFPDRISPVKDAALAFQYAAYGASGKLQLLVSGGQDTLGEASPKMLIVDFDALRTVLDTSVKLKPGVLSDGNKVFRYGTHVVAPMNPASPYASYFSDMTDLIFYTGADNLEDDDEPLLTEFVVVDATLHKVLPRCSSANRAQSTCKVLPVPRGNNGRDDLPPPRDGLALTFIHQVFTRVDGDYNIWHVGGKLLLMYGGMRLVGNSLNSSAGDGTAGDSVLSAAEQGMRDTLAVCDTQGSLDSVELDNMAQCTWPRAVAQSRQDTDEYDYDFEYNTDEMGEAEYAYSPPALEYMFDQCDCPCTPMYGGDSVPPPPPPPPPPSPPAAGARHRRRAAEEAPYDDSAGTEQGSAEKAAERFSSGRMPLAVKGGRRRRSRGGRQDDEENGHRYQSTARRVARKLHGTEAFGAPDERSRWLIAGNGGGAGAASSRTATGADAWGNRAATAAAAGAAAASVQQLRIKQSFLKLSQRDATMDTVAPTVYGTAYAVLYQSSDDVADANLHLIDPSVEYTSSNQTKVLQGPGFYFDLLMNVNGSTKHAPGERAAATLVNLPYLDEGGTNADAILFGGLTAVNQSADNDMLGVPLLTNDLYYLQYIPAVPADDGSAGDLATPRFLSCPFNDSSGRPHCKSVAVFPQQPPNGTSADPSMPPPPSPPRAPRLPPVNEGSFFDDCPNELLQLPPGTNGTYQLRVYRSINKTLARSMKVIISGDNIDEDISALKDAAISRGPCCAGNNSQWSWPPEEFSRHLPSYARNRTAGSTSSTTNVTVDTSVDAYWLTLPNGIYEVKIISSGSGWTAAEDMLSPLNCSTGNLTRCPRVELYSLEANRTIRGMGGFAQQAATWIAAPNATDDYYRIFRLSLCGTLPPPPPRSPPPRQPPSASRPPPSEEGSDAPPPAEKSQNKYPFAVPGQPNLLRSFELQLAPDHPMDQMSLPRGRMWHASCFMETKDLPESLGFGTQGLLVVHGGVANHQIDAIDIETELLDDLWVFDLEFRRWIRMTGDGDDPGKRLRHNMKAEGSVIFLSGGFTYDPERQNWPYDTKVYYMDVQLGVDAIWTQADGDDATLGYRTSPTAITQGMGVSQRRSQLVTMNDQGINFVPMPISARLIVSSKNNSSNGTRDSTSAARTSGEVLTGYEIEVAIDNMYDGDLLLLPEDVDLSISGVLTIDAAVVFHGGVVERTSSPSPPSAPPSAGRRLAGLQQQNLQPLLRAQRVGGEDGSVDGFQGGDIDDVYDDDASCTAGGRGCGGGFAVAQQPGSSHLSSTNDRRRSGQRVLLPQAELQAALQGKSQRLTITRSADSDKHRAVREASREGLKAVRRLLQAASSPSSAAVVPPDVDVAAWLAINRLRVVCVTAATIVLKAAPIFVDLEFVGCQIDVGNTADATVSFVNCVFRDTIDRPAILVRPGGRVAIQGSLFHNNTFLSPDRNSSSVLAATNVSATNGTASSPSLYWGAGSAIYVMPRGTIEQISESAFVGNGNGPGSTRGGAIFLTGPGACLEGVADSTFQRNGRLSGGSGGSGAAAANFLGGGAVYGTGIDGCDLIVRGSNFSGNAGGDGGAVFLTQSGARNINFSASHFWNNTARWGGGALFVSSASGRLALRDTTFVGNVASERGGAISLESVTVVAAEGLLLQRNSAATGLGGGLAQSRQGVLDLVRSTVSYNTALYGGGLSCAQDLDVRLTDTAILNNTAAAHAGGLECYQCYQFLAVRTNFSRNRAPSGGGLVLTKVEQGGLLNAVQLYDNIGMPTDGSAAKIDQVGCARDARGGGGALCMDLHRTVTLRDVRVVNNTAIAGGGAFVQQRCLPGDASCGPAVMYDSVFAGNVARGGGGGAVFRTTHNLTNVTCPGDSAPTEWRDLIGACPGTWVQNSAVYGNITATIAYGLALDSPSRLPSYRSNDPLEVVVRLRDYHNQTIFDGTREATTTLEVRQSRGSTSSILLAGSSISTIRGLGNFTSTLKLQARPATYFLLVAAPRTIQDVPSQEIEVVVRPCKYGEITNVDGTQCYPCTLGTFSLNSSKTVCDNCPDNANCSLEGLPWVTLPKPGYWHSGPRSPNILPCAYGPACDQTMSWPRQNILASHLKALGNGTEPYNATAYQVLQCAKGYTGRLCCRCQPGYGRSNSGKCTKCAGRALNTLWYILCSFINILLIFITVRTQLPGSLTSLRRLERIQEDQTRHVAQQRAAVRLWVRNLHPDSKKSAAASGTATGVHSAVDQPLVSSSGPQDRPVGQAGPPGPAKAQPPQKQGPVAGTAQQQVVEIEKLLPLPPPPAPPPQPYPPPKPLEPPSSVRQQQQQQQQQQACRAKGDKGGPGLGLPRTGTSEPAELVRSPSCGSASSQEEDGVVQVDEDDGPYKGGNYGIVFKIFMSYLQVASLIRSVSAPWPSVLEVFLSLAKTVSNSITTFVSIDCSLRPYSSLPRSVQRVIIIIATPFAIMALALVLWLILFAVHRLRRHALGASFAGYLRPRAIITLIAIVFYVYPDLTNTLLSLFSCPVVDPEKDDYSDFMEAKGTYWGRDYDIKCYVKTHMYLVAIVGVPGVLLFAIGAPIFSFVWLRTHHHLLYTSPDFGVAYGFMYRDYRRESYFWDSVVMFRKLAVIALVVFLQPEGEFIQIIASLGVILLALLAQITIKPYKNSRMNELERLSLYALVAILYFALLLLASIPRKAKYALGMILTLANITLVIYFIYKILEELWLCILWTIDSESNADGRLEWEDVWRYVEARHSNKSYASALVKALKGVQRVSVATHNAVVQPIGAVVRASSQIRDRVLSRSRIKPLVPADSGATPPLALPPPSAELAPAASGSTDDSSRGPCTTAPALFPSRRSTNQPPTNGAGSGTLRPSPALQNFRGGAPEPFAGQGGTTSTADAESDAVLESGSTAVQQYGESSLIRGMEPAANQQLRAAPQRSSSNSMEVLYNAPPVPVPAALKSASSRLSLPNSSSPPPSAGAAAAASGAAVAAHRLSSQSRGSSPRGSSPRCRAVPSLQESLDPRAVQKATTTENGEGDLQLLEVDVHR